MYIKSSIVEDYGNFELDAGAVKLSSLSSKDIKLPYTGPLPRKMSMASGAHLYFNVQPTQRASVVLVADLANGRQIKRPLRASNEELISLLDKFFSQRGNDGATAGMDDFNFGQWRGQYMDWRKIVTTPICLMPILTAISRDSKNYIINNIFSSF